MLQKKNTELNIDPLPHRDAFYAFASRADPDQAALVREYDISDPTQWELTKISLFYVPT